MKTVLLLSLAVAGAACSPFSPDLGAAPFTCGTSDPKCPDGYDCVPNGSAGAMVCLQAGGSIPDAASTQCADDSNLEPNETIQTAYITPVADQGPKTISYAGLAICPTGDKDTYKVTTVTTGQTLQAEIEFDPNGANLTLVLLSANGTLINTGSPNGAGKLKAVVATLPVGPVYAQVTGPAAGAALTTNNYKLTLTVSP